MIIVLLVILITILIIVITKIVKNPVGKIYKTTDGYFADNQRNKKKRNVVVLEQRPGDNAVAVAKIEKERDKDKKFFVQD